MKAEYLDTLLLLPRDFSGDAVLSAGDMELLFPAELLRRAMAKMAAEGGLEAALLDDL